MIGVHTGLPWPAIYHRRGGGGPTPYIAKAVRSDLNTNTPVRILSLTAVDSSKISTAGWIRIPQSVFNDGGPNVKLWVLGNNNIGRTFWNNAGDFSANLGESGVGTLFAITPAAIFVPDTWTWVGAAFDMNFPAGSRIFISYVGDTPTGLSPIPDGTDLGGPFVIPLNGAFYALANGAGATEMADMSLWAGQTIDFSIEANRRKFISASGKPVDPAIAVAAFGTPTILQSGDATDFVTNQGSGGAAEIQSGALTNAATSPSD